MWKGVYVRSQFQSLSVVARPDTAWSATFLSAVSSIVHDQQGVHVIVLNHKLREIVVNLALGCVPGVPGQNPLRRFEHELFFEEGFQISNLGKSQSLHDSSKLKLFVAYLLACV